MSWDEEKVNKLRELWGKGKTASQIAEVIGGFDMFSLTVVLIIIVVIFLRLECH